MGGLVIEIGLWNFEYIAKLSLTHGCATSIIGGVGDKVELVMKRLLIVLGSLVLVGCGPLELGPDQVVSNIDDPAVRVAIANLVNRSKRFHGNPLFPSLSWVAANATIGGPVPRGGWDAYCVEMEFPNALLLTRSGGQIRIKKFRYGRIETELRDHEGYTSLIGIKEPPCGEVPMQPFPEAVTSRKLYIEGK